MTGTTDISVISTIRGVIARVLEGVLDGALGKSEAALAAEISLALAAHASLTCSGWYTPPPGGIAVLTAHPSDFSRLSFDSLRKREFWPSPELKVDSESVVMAYASPVHRDTLLIGDYGCTRYFGHAPQIHEHIELCRKILNDVAASISVGIEFRELYRLANICFSDAQLFNEATASRSDPAGTNIGHTIPYSFADDSPPHLRQDAEIPSMIAAKRKFISSAEVFSVPENGAFTLEARLRSKVDNSLPNVLVHKIITIRRGRIQTF